MADEDAITFDAQTVIVCDDIRREDNGKSILIGVYNASILVQQFPYALGIAFWLQGMPSDGGAGKIGVKISAGEAVFVNNVAPISFVTKELSSIAIGPIPCFFSQASELKLEIRSRETEPWVTVKTIQIARQPVAAA